MIGTTRDGGRAAQLPPDFEVISCVWWLAKIEHVSKLIAGLQSLLDKHVSACVQAILQLHGTASLHGVWAICRADNLRKISKLAGSSLRACVIQSASAFWQRACNSLQCIFLFCEDEHLPSNPRSYVCVVTRGLSPSSQEYAHHSAEKLLEDIAAVCVWEQMRDAGVLARAEVKMPCSLLHRCLQQTPGKCL